MDPERKVSGRLREDQGTRWRGEEIALPEFPVSFLAAIECSTRSRRETSQTFPNIFGR